jgi:hypothetical protein
MKNAVFLDLTPCGSCKSRQFSVTHSFQHQGVRNQRVRNVRSNLKIKHTLASNVVPRSLILSTLRMEVIRSFETSEFIRAMLRHIPEVGILLVRNCFLKRNLATNSFEPI